MRGGFSAAHPLPSSRIRSVPAAVRHASKAGSAPVPLPASVCEMYIDKARPPSLQKQNDQRKRASVTGLEVPDVARDALAYFLPDAERMRGADI